MKSGVIKMSDAFSGLEAKDRLILDYIQSDFPLAPRPYAVIGESLGMAEEEVFARVRKMRASGLIRRLGANFQSGKVGFASTLCAAKVPQEKKMDFIDRINALPGVTHNYERDHPYNIWFTLICQSGEEAQKILSGLSEESGVEILNLPATKLYKIKVDFPMK